MLFFFPASNPEVLAWGTPSLTLILVFIITLQFLSAAIDILKADILKAVLEGSFGMNSFHFKNQIEIQQLSNCPKIKVKDKFHYKLKNQPRSVPGFRVLV